MNTFVYDVAVIGGGCAGMAAACAAKEKGAERVLILERSPRLGGVLRQCIHNGFGIHHFGEDLTGTEYAARLIRAVQAADIDVFTETTALRLSKERIITAVNHTGLFRIRAGAVIVASGCRERPRGALSIPGSRPVGVMTAGTAQRLLNLEGYLPGRKIVILGSGDIGLIMARQFVLEGADVKSVIEIQPFSSGLSRNIVQCIEDFHIPLYYSTTVTRIEGARRVSGVWIAQVNDQKKPLPGTERFIECDTLILSVGLIPENELLWQSGIPLDPSTGGAIVDETFQTEVPGIFACGNALHVHDLADYVVQESRQAGHNAALWLRGQLKTRSPLIQVQAGEGVRGIVPQRLHADTSPILLQFRPSSRYQNRRITVYADGVLSWSCRYRILTPGEMCSIQLRTDLLAQPASVINSLKVQVEV